VDDSFDPGPLPKSDNNSLLQRLSFQALEKRLDQSRFIFRRTQEIDCRVDGTLELRILGHYTNMFSHIQVKSFDNASPTNRDGSISYEIATSNLNYILNGPSPLYMIYSTALDQVRYVWAGDEQLSLETRKPEWKSQQTITIRFSKVLDDDGMREIFDRIRSETIISRRIRDTLSRTSVAENVSLNVNRQTQTVSDPTAIRDLLLKGGLSLVSSGQAITVSSLVELLSPEDRRHPRVLLVRAFASIHQSRYAEATGFLMDLRRCISGLDPSDQEFADYLQDACDFETGRITLEEYSRKEKEAASKASSDLGLSRSLNYFWHALLSVDGDEERRAKADSLKETANLILSTPERSATLKLMARIAVMYVEGWQSIDVWTSKIAVAQSANRVAVKAKALETGSGTIESWMKDSVNVVADAFASQNPLIIADAISTRAIITFTYFYYNLLILSETLDSVIPGTQAMVAILIPELEQAIHLYQGAGSLLGEVRSKLMLANYLDLMDRQDDAVKLAREALSIALAYRFDSFAVDAQRHIDGLPFHREMVERTKGVRSKDEDEYLSRHSDAEMYSLALHVMESHDLPIERLPNILSECKSWRAVAQEHLNWCRHLELVQSLEHEQKSETHFANPPERFGRCVKLKFDSRFGHQDWETVLRSFKSAYCSNCAYREPKNLTANTT